MGTSKRSAVAPPPAGVRRTERLEARVTAEEKELLVTAAELAGRGLSEFVVGAATKAARDQIRRRNTLHLSVEDAAAFVEALMNPPAPTKQLRDAARRYRQETGGSRAQPA
jgi:uncharacterized protein (DUF1778 family)